VFRKGGVLVGGDELPHDLGIFPRPEPRQLDSTVPKFRQSPTSKITGSLEHKHQADSTSTGRRVFWDFQDGIVWEAHGEHPPHIS
jgi:hypothetical protein